jgi:exodeoxyribonuclease VII large subunit
MVLRLRRARRSGLDGAAGRLAAGAAALAHLDPTRVLARGYAVVRDSEGKALRGSAGLSPGAALDITLATGGVAARVEKPY